MRQARLELIVGPDAPAEFRLGPGDALVVGRHSAAQAPLKGDQALSRRHFQVRFDGEVCQLSDLGSRSGTYVNDQAVTETTVEPGATIRAGMSVFLLHLEDAVEPATAAPGVVGYTREELEDEAVIPPPLRQAVIQALRASGEPLFAILDAAQGGGVRRLLDRCPEEHRSLYEGEEGARLDSVAPHLVALPEDSAFLEAIVTLGWGKSWAVLLNSAEPFAAVRKHLRHFLLVTNEKNEQVYFRYYDPRVLAAFLPACTPAELTEFFGPIRRFLLEGPDPDVLLAFTLADATLERIETRLEPVSEAATKEAPR